VIREIEKILQPGAVEFVSGRMPYTPRAKKVIEYAIEEAREQNHDYVGTEHLLLGLLREGEAVAAQVLMMLGLSVEATRAEVARIRPPGWRRPDITGEPVVVPLPPSSLLTEQQAETMRELIRQLTERKEELVKALNFEDASRCRDATRALERIFSKLLGG
jgi:ATP-dependent Clp protease ATP-binding subunit ClpA